MAMGAGVNGGRVLLRDGVWPGLAPENLDREEDLVVTTDFRDIFAEVLARHMGSNVGDLATVFPNFSVDTANYPGLFV